MKICIDPGHGLDNIKTGVYDPGATAYGRTEAAIVLEWALTLKAYLTKAGHDVWMTRYDDNDSDYVGTRDNRANAEGCDIFISLHCNAGTILAHGAEVIYRDSADLKLAERMLAATLAATRFRNRGCKTESSTHVGKLAVMDFKGPACLVEIGFITNPGNLIKMVSRETRIAFAKNVVEALKTYKL